MKIKAGSVVRATAGRDCGGYFVVLSCADGFCLIADGKSRKLDAPKRKNVRHVALTNSMIDVTDLTDKKLRTQLRTISGGEQ